MLVLNVTFHCEPGKREELRELIREEGIDVTVEEMDKRLFGK